MGVVEGASLCHAQGSVDAPADEADAGVGVSVHPAGAVGITDVQEAAGQALVDVPKLVLHAAGVVAQVLDGAVLLELRAVLLVLVLLPAAAVQVHGCLQDTVCQTLAVVFGPQGSTAREELGIGVWVVS